MRVYRAVTGGGNLRAFWKMSPAEVFAWSAAIEEDRDDPFGELEPGEEIED